MAGALLKKIWSYDPTLYAPSRYRRGCEYFSFVPDQLADIAISLPGDTSATVSEAETAIATLNARNDPALLPLARLLLRTESIASSKVEGMQVDAQRLARAEVARDTGRNIGTEAAEIIANIDAMQFAIETVSSAAEIVPENLASIHRVLLERAPNSEMAGQYRTKQNWIGGNDYNPCGADFVPPPPEAVESLLSDLCTFCNKDELSPLVQAAIAHAQFETIHPFNDGNGRTGRALIQVILRRRRLAPTFTPPISVILARDRDRYIQGLTLFREDRTDDWINAFASASVQAARLAVRYLQAVTELQDRWKAQLKGSAKPPRTDAAAWAIIGILPVHPVLTVPVAVAATKRTRPSVNDAVRELEGRGVLARISSSPRYRAWEAVGLLDLVAQLETGT